MGQAKIVLGTDSGSFWTGLDSEPWSDDPLDAAVYTDPREAWTTALALRSTNSDYLEDSPVELHLLDPDGPELTSRVLSTVASNNRPLMRARWRKGFRQALPLDLPNRVDDVSITEQRLNEYFDDFDRQTARGEAGSPALFVDRLDTSVKDALDRLLSVDQERANRLLCERLPAGVVSGLLDRGRVGDESSPAPQYDRSDRGGHAEPNEILRIRERDQPSQHSLPPSSSASPLPDNNVQAQEPRIPEFVQRHFVQAEARFYYRQKPEQLAFEARGETFRAHDASVSVATAMVAMAEARGWSALKVKGSEDFRRLVWAAAAKRRLAVEGYSPSAGERAMLGQDQDAASGPPREDAVDSRTDGRQRERPANPLTGTLVDHGSAAYRKQQGNSPSYFVTLRSESGSMATHWGLDLERALDESRAHVGDEVRLVRLGKQQVRVQEPVRDQQGNVVDHVTKETERNGWSVTVLSRSERSDDTQRRQRPQADSDLIASKVVELFTAERLGRLPLEDRARFRELYDHARARLHSREMPTHDPSERPGRDVASRDRHRERAAQGR